MYTIEDVRAQGEKIKEELKKPHEIDASIDGNLSEVIYAMIHPDSDKRAVVFSELEERLHLDAK